MNRNALQTALSGIRKRCDSAGQRKIFDALLQRCPTVYEWAGKQARGDSVNVPWAARQLEYVYQGAVEVQFPALAFANQDGEGPLVKWDTSVPRGAKTFVWYYSEGAGSAEFFAAMGSDGLPSPTIMGAEQHGRVESFGTKIQVRLDQLQAAAFAGQNLDQQLGRADKQGHAQLLNDTAAWGREDIGIPGLLNHPQINIATAATKAAGGTTWAVATAGELIADVLGLVNGIQNDSRELHRPNVIALPARYIRMLAQTQLSEDGTAGNLVTAMEFLEKALEKGGTPCRFRPCEDLMAENSLGNLDSDAILAFNDSPEFVSLVVPFYYDVLSPQEVDHWINTPTWSAMGGIKLPYPITVAMLKGIG